MAAIQHAITLLLAVLVLPSLCGCGKYDADSAPEPDDTQHEHDGNAHPLSGSFHGNLLGTPMSLELHVDGEALSGELRLIDGSRYPLNGSIDGSAVFGQVQDPDGGGAFTASINGDELNWNMTLNIPGRGIEQHAISFQRGAARGVEPQQLTRDSSIVGRWRNTVTNAEAGFVMDTWFVLNPDGTFRLGDYKQPGSPLITHESIAGQWQTADSVIYLATIAAPDQWQPLARYYVEGDAMLLTYADGSELAWHRR